MSLSIRLMATVALLVNSFILPASWAYDSAKCKSELGHTNTALTSSSTSYVTSTGPCAAIGMRDERERFIHQNVEAIMADSARGFGEYLEALALTSGCKSDLSRDAFRSIIYKNFRTVYSDDEPKGIMKQIDTLILSEPVLRRNCRLTS